MVFWEVKSEKWKYSFALYLPNRIPLKILIYRIINSNYQFEKQPSYILEFLLLIDILFLFISILLLIF